MTKFPIIKIIDNGKFAGLGGLRAARLANIATGGTVERKFNNDIILTRYSLTKDRLRRDYPIDIQNIVDSHATLIIYDKDSKSALNEHFCRKFGKPYRVALVNKLINRMSNELNATCRWLDNDVQQFIALPLYAMRGGITLNIVGGRDNDVIDLTKKFVSVLIRRYNKPVLK